MKRQSKKYNGYVLNNRVPDHFDKIKAFYIEGRKLSDVQEKQRLKYEEAHRLRVAGYSKEQVIKILKQKELIASDRVGYTIVNGAEILFGDIAASNREGMRVILTENFLSIYQWAKKNSNMKEANRALENVAKINNLYKEDDPVDWDSILIPIPVYTTNPQALRQPEIEDAEIITTN
jgi:hypothetical protein